MTTKAQERAALEKIRKIVDGLGENSYIGTAMAGMFEDAETNIENDWAMSWKDRAESAQRDCDRLRAKTDEAYGKYSEMKQRAERAEEMFNKAQGRVDTWVARYHEMEDVNTENCKIASEAQAKVRELEDEIIKLKAKLYDMMTA